MKALTLWQPSASLVACGAKRIETRSWKTDYRGLIAIHAAKRPVIDAEVEAIYAALRRSEDHEKLSKLFSEELPLGRIVAIANLTDCLRMIGDFPDPRYVYPSRGLISIEAQTPLEQALGDWRPGRYAWKFNPVLKLIHLIDFKGGQKLRVLPSEIVELIEKTNGFSKGTK